jgi:hypothetical protein
MDMVEGMRALTGGPLFLPEVFGAPGEREEKMTPPTSLTRDELKQARADLEGWLSPKDFGNKVEMLDRRITSSEHFISTELKFLRDDAWVLAEFARLINADSVRLARETERFPDGHVKVSGNCLKIEITEADRKGRRRGDEYKPDAPRVTCDPINNAETVATALEQAIKNKVEKNYAPPPPPTLVVNLNLGVHGNREQETKLESLIAAVKKRYTSQFAGIYVLRNNKLL